MIQAESELKRAYLAGAIDRRAFVRGLIALGVAAPAAVAQARAMAAQDATPAATTAYEWRSVGARTVEGADTTYEFPDRTVLVSTAGPAELEFWTINLQGPFGNWIEGFLEDYQTVNEGVEIEWVDVPGAEVAQKYLTAVSAGQAPDVANVYEMPRFVELDALANIAEYLPEADAADFYDTFWQGLTFDGQVFAMPWYSSTSGLMISRKLLEDAGLDPNTVPTTWDEAMEMSRTIKDATDKYGLLMTVGQGELVQLLQQDGIPLVSEDRTTAALNTPEAVALFEKWRTFYKDGYLPPEGTTANPRDANQWYYAARGAFVPKGAVEIVRRAEDGVLEQLDADVAAGLRGTAGKAVASVQYFVISASSENIQAAVDLGAYVTGTSMQVELITQVSILPTRESVTTDPEFRAKFIDNPASGRSREELIARDFQISLAQLTDAVLDFNAAPPVVGWARMYDLFKAETNKMFATDQSAADTLANIESGWNEILAEGA
jgi:ABC-type glycerol-3-phosphate transport system substrate-binding protein